MNWIKITEKPPQRLPIWITDGLVSCEGYWVENMGFFNRNGTGVRVTHWMHIVPPEPPK